MRNQASIALIFAIAATASAAENSLEIQTRQLVEPAIRTGWLASVSVGILRATEGQGSQGREVVVLGLGSARDDRLQSPNADTLYEIGSITKVFTALLLADMVVRGEVKLDDPVQKHLPDSVRMPTRDDLAITLEQLATHRSGLPRMPNNFQPRDPDNPYADYDVERLYAFLNRYKLRHAPGERGAYSNLGMGLLGHALARAAGKTYAELLRERITGPLAMHDTVIDLDERQRGQLAQPHDADGNVVKNWDLNVLAGAGALRSNIHDLLKFVAAQLKLEATPLEPAIELTHAARGALQGTKAEIGLGWHITLDGRAIGHNGQTGGYHSYLSFRPHVGAGVVVLSNTASEVVDRLGYSLMQLACGEEPEPMRLRATATLSPDTLERYVGDYDLQGERFSITREDDKLFAQLSIQPKLRIYPENETKFFYRVVDAQIAFETDEQGEVTGLTLHQFGRELTGKRKK
jgi:CubicO group peptidase (beta-lactamase class C family)